MTAIIAAFVNHPRVIAIVACVVLLALAGVAVYRSGERRQSQTDAIAVLNVKRADSAAATAEALRAVNLVKQENDSLRARNASLTVRNDSLTGIANTRLTAARLVESRLSVKDDTASVTTDSGVVKVPIAHVLAVQLASDKRATDSAFSAMEHKEQSDADLIAGLAHENDGLRTQIQLDSVVQNRYRGELAVADAEIEAANKQNHPRFTFTQGTVVGAIVTVAARIAVAILIHR